MHKSGITDYEAFSRELIAAIPAYPLSLEVFADDNDEMLRQGRKIATWGENVYVKIPVTNTRRETTAPVVESADTRGRQGQRDGADDGRARCATSAASLDGGAPGCISVFAGRVADTGRDPLPIMTEALEVMRPHPGLELIWASPRELLNVFHADSIGTHIITVTHDILAKLSLVGKDLDDYSLDTVKMFAKDAVSAGFTL